MSRASLILVLGIVLLLLAAACNPFESDPTPVPIATPSATPAVDDSWQQISDAGTIAVGVAADYPPFSYYVDQHLVDGLDIALMQEIAKYLDLRVVYRNYLFEDLFDAMQRGQVDVAIAAISSTQERQAYVDFTNIYYVTQDAALAVAGRQITVEHPEDLAGYQVGVEGGTVYEHWLRSELLDTGLMRPGGLWVYDTINEAIADLRDRRLDVVVMDLPPAQLATEEGDLVIAGQGFSQQLLALAVPKGHDALRAEIDRAMNRLQTQGTLAELAVRYMGLDASQIPIIPTKTPRPGASATPPPTGAVPTGAAPCVPTQEANCTDNLSLLQHVTGGICSKSVAPLVNPGQPFTKVWRVKNTGTCTWDCSYQLVYVSGSSPEAQMGGQPTSVLSYVPPGAEYDVGVDLVAPQQPGTYQAWWRMQNRYGVLFGDPLELCVTVPGAVTATPGPYPTPTPPSDIYFTVDRTDIVSGECVTFYWKVANAQAVYFYAQGELWWEHPVASEGSQVECPPVTTTYFLHVVKLDGSIEIQQITIYVQPAAGGPIITHFSVHPPSQITLGECVEVRWSVEGTVNRVTITANGSPLWQHAPKKGNLRDCPPRAGTVQYAIEAVGPGGTSRQAQAIQVIPRATATPSPPPQPAPPVIYAFSVRPRQIQAGECVSILWETGGGTKYVRILRNGDRILDNGPIRGARDDCLDTEGSYLYRLEAYNAAGQFATEEQRVEVTSGGPGDPLAGTSWLATAYYDSAQGQMVRVLQGTRLTTAFSQDQVSGSGGCNTYSGPYRVDEDSLRIGPLTTSQMLCSDPEGIMEQERAFLADLQSAASYTLEAGQLYVLDASRRVVIEFIAGQ
jgi:ABC-type amino acid transport substrate-binding protein/heat shock protein HslJ